MTLVVIGPVTEDIIRIGSDESCKIGGATYYQSFVFEKFYNDYLAIVNCYDESLAEDFPNSDKVKVIKKEDTHFFINNYPDKDNRNIREQLSNFPSIPVLPSDLDEILPEKIDGFVVNPLNRYDFPAETIEYLKSFEVPIFMSIQGFLRLPNNQVNGNYTIKLSHFDELNDILSNVDVIFMDEAEVNIIGIEYDVGEMVITNGSHGSRILADDEIKIEPVHCDDVVDTTGCGDTYMASYIVQKLLMKSPEDAGNFASRIASEKIKNSGPYNFNK